MITEGILQLLVAEPFLPFTIHPADGGALRVPTRRGAVVLEPAARVFVFEKKGLDEMLAPNNITRLSAALSNGRKAKSS